MISDIQPIPFHLDEVLGQPIALRYLKNYTKNREKIPPLLILHGPSGVGKQFAADRFVKTVLCLNGTSCGHCPSCSQFLKQTHPDYIEFPEDERIPIGDDRDPKEFTVRWLQSQRIVYAPMLSMYRIVLIPDATKINTEAETALLKTLEEAPNHTRFIFLVEDIRTLKSTISSRAVLIPFYYLPKDTVQQIAGSQNIYVHEFQGGSFQMNFIEPEIWEEYTMKVRNSIYESILIIQLESWVREHKTKHPEWNIDFDYKKFLELISSLMIFEYSKNSSQDWTEAIETIYEFKEFLHRDINGMENFLISRMFGKISLLLH